MIMEAEQFEFAVNKLGAQETKSEEIRFSDDINSVKEQEDWYHSSAVRQANSLLVFLFYSDFELAWIGWCSSALERTICFIQSIYSDISLIQNPPQSPDQMSGHTFISDRLTHKINHPTVID